MQILGILKNLSQNNAQREELNYLIQVSRKISKAYLIRNYSRITRLFKFFDLNIEESSLDAIAELFCQKTNSGNIEIVNAFNSWKPPVTSESEALFFINKITASAVEQHLSVMLRESDPFFSKIYNSVNYYIKKKGFQKIIFAGSKYIVKSDFNAADKNFIDYKNFEAIPVKYFLNKENFLDDVFSYIFENTPFTAAIPLNILSARIKSIYLEGHFGNTTEFPEFRLVDEAIDAGLKSSAEHLKDKYLQKGKLSEEEVKHFISAIKDMSRDMRDGGLNPGIMKYLVKYIPDLYESGKYDNYHNILEYLLKNLKKQIFENLQEKND